MSENGWIKLNRSVNTLEVLKRPNVFALLTQIAIRARRTNQLNIHGLAIGEALIGDHAACGLTRQEYRTAKRKIEKMGLASFKTTSKGTIATILDTSIYDINIELEQPATKPTANQPATDKQPKYNQQPTTNNNLKKEKNGNKSTTTEHVVDDDIFPDVLKKKLSHIGMTSQGAMRLYKNCNSDCEKMLKWLLWGIDQKKAANTAGLIITQSKKGDIPFLSSKLQKDFDQLLLTESKKWANKAFNEFKENNQNLTKGILIKISNSELGYKMPRNKSDYNKLLKAIKINKYDLNTGLKVAG